MSNIKFRPGFYISIALGLFIIPVPWLMAWIIAALIHELFHIAALKLLGFSIQGVSIGAAGAQIETDGESGKKMIICALAGPLAGLMLFMLLNVFPRIAICGIVQSMGNLIPLYPLDGGRVLENVLFILFPNRISVAIYKTVEIIVMLVLLLISGICTIRFNLGIMPMLMMCLFLIQKKFLANNGFSEYNIRNRN